MPLRSAESKGERGARSPKESAERGVQRRVLLALLAQQERLALQVMNLIRRTVVYLIKRAEGAKKRFLLISNYNIYLYYRFNLLILFLFLSLACLSPLFILIFIIPQD